MELLWLTLLCGMIIYLIARGVMHKIRYRTLLKTLPGPEPHPIIGNMLLFKIPAEERLKMLAKLRNVHGDVLVTWQGIRPVVHLFHPRDIEVLLGANNKHVRKGRAYDFLLPWLGTGLLTSSSHKWFTHRKLITPTFHFKILESFIEVFNESSDILVRSLNKHIDGAHFNICPYISFCALDIICETAMGTKVAAQQNCSNPYVSATLRISDLITRRQFNLLYRISFIFFNTNLGKEFKEQLKIVHDFSKDVIRGRKAQRQTAQTNPVDTDNFGVKKKVAFLDLLLDSAESEKVPLSDDEIREEVDTFMFEGHDTTTMAVCWTLLLLGNNREIQSAVRSELKMIFHEGKKAVTLRDLGEMKLLERVIKEALRLYPSVPIITRSTDAPITLGGCEIPPQTDVAVQIYNMHRNPAVYPNPMKFDPDRFLPQAVQKRHPYAYIPFSAGQRNCIGQKFAIYEEKVILSSILRNYEVIARDLPEDVPTCAELVCRPKNGEIFVKLVPIT